MVPPSRSAAQTSRSTAPETPRPAFGRRPVLDEVGALAARPIQERVRCPSHSSIRWPEQKQALPAAVLSQLVRSSHPPRVDRGSCFAREEAVRTWTRQRLRGTDAAGPVRWTSWIASKNSGRFISKSPARARVLRDRIRRSAAGALGGLINKCEVAARSISHPYASAQVSRGAGMCRCRSGQARVGHRSAASCLEQASQAAPRVCRRL
jgi:hypothetical protein